MLWQTQGEGVQIALTNGGGIRASIEAGDVSVGDVLTVLPFGNLISTFELTGAEVVEALENGILKKINKGVTTESLINTVKRLSKSVKVTIGLLLFIPRVTETQLKAQLSFFDALFEVVFRRGEVPGKKGVRHEHGSNQSQLQPGRAVSQDP